MKSKSFTLIELLVVIVIIGILAGVIIISTSSSINKAGLAKGMVFSESVKKSLFFDIVSEWNFDDPTSIGKDDAGNNNLIFYNFLSESENNCMFSKCVYTSGVGVTYYGIKSFFPIPQKDLTISFWFKAATDGPSAPHILSYAVVGTDNELLIRFADSNILIYVNGVIRTYVAKVRDNSWHSLVFVRDRLIGDNTNNILYIDGMYIDNISEATGDLALDGSLVIGQDQDGVGGGFDATQTYKGYIDEMIIYNSVLSSSQVKQNHVAGLNALLSSGNILKEDYNQRISSLSEK